MASTRKTLIVGAVTALEAGCLLGVACLGRGLLPLERAAAEAVPLEIEARPGPIQPIDLETPKAEEGRAVDRIAMPEVVTDEGAPAGVDAARAPRKESEFYAAFLEIAAREPDSFERAARNALGEAGPDCRKVAALRALCDTRSPTADDALVAAILELPDAASGDSESVPGFALRRLSMRATKDAGARRALERLVFGSSRPQARLRAAAAAALCAAADEVELGRIAERLRGESDELVLACAGAALSRNPNTRAAEEARSSLGLPDPPTAETAEREE